MQLGETLYQNDFKNAALDQVPEELLILDGAFSVKEAEGNRFLQLPGSPLDSFGVLFGPTEKDGVVVGARIYGTSRGRRAPTFAVGCNGAAGYRLQVTPGKKALELFRGDTLKVSQPYEWRSGQWTLLRLRVQKNGAGWQVSGKAWTEGTTEPTEWLISLDDNQELQAGRAGVFGSPFADTPIRFDDLLVARLPARQP